MRNLFLIVSFLLILNGCTNDIDVIDTPSKNNGTVTLKAVISGADTRVAMAQDELDVLLTWETTDVLQLCFTDGDIRRQVSAPVETISADGKQATFTLTIPEGITSSEFQLNGVVGGELSTTPGEEDVVILPDTPWSGASLDEIQSKGLHVAAFETQTIDADDPVLDVNLVHLGSLFSIQLNNTGDNTWSDIKKVQLNAENTVGAYIAGGKYNLSTGTYSEMNNTGTALPFELSTSTGLAAGERIEFWGWYIPIADEVWPALTLQVLDATDNVLATTTDSKPARTAPTVPGRAFYFEAYWDGTNLAFTKTLEKLEGTLIGHSGSWGDNPATRIEAAVDGDLSTFVDGPGSQGYVGYLFEDGEAAVIRSARYAPRSGYAERMVGGEIRGSNDPNLTDYVVLHKITDEPPVGMYTEIEIEASEQSFRFIYYTNPESGSCNIAEIEFYGDITESDIVFGEYIWNFNSDGDNLGWTPQGAEWTVEGGILNVIFPQVTGNKRADLRYTKLPVTFHTGAFPILAMKADITSAARITFDTNRGEFGAGFNKYSTEFLESHGVYYWNMSTLRLGSGGEVHANQELFFNSTLQFKIADIPEADESTSYTVEWIRTFESKEALQAFLNGE